ncbi:putative vivid protein [Chaetomium fimeti]|uniref:Vivid protein n=1 Tax=Chaetomium fimeti TaxID=1854472 RepID=A0AAE0HAH2_9PEZI|nr:putative vivid protein [Chaetomium fimeti]
MTAQMNTWEEQAVMWQVSNPQIQDPLIYPGLYSPSGIDILTILATIHTRPNPTVPLGPVDASCAILIADLAQPDQPIIYASQPFTALTGYSAAEALGRNCRFLQAPPPLVYRDDGGDGDGKDGGGGTVGNWDGGGGRGAGGNRDSGVARRRGCGGLVDGEVVRRMGAAVQGRREVQVEVVNYRKSGEPFLNLLSIIPVRVGSGLDLSVGFLCDAASLE